MNNLTQKEKGLLQDQKTHEEVCVKKYNEYANKAKDSQLKQLFNTIAQQEQQRRFLLDPAPQLLTAEVDTPAIGLCAGKEVPALALGIDLHANAVGVGQHNLLHASTSGGFCQFISYTSQGQRVKVHSLLARGKG